MDKRDKSQAAPSPDRKHYVINIIDIFKINKYYPRSLPRSWGLVLLCLLHDVNCTRPTGLNVGKKEIMQLAISAQTHHIVYKRTQYSKRNKS